jgi:hypothetical protein
MFFIPGWISNILLFITIVISAIQHVVLKRANPVTNLQFFMIAFALVMILVITFHNRDNPWLSLAFFAIAAGSLAYMIRQQRMLPPSRAFE